LLVVLVDALVERAMLQVVLRLVESATPTSQAYKPRPRPRPRPKRLRPEPRPKLRPKLARCLALGTATPYARYLALVTAVECVGLVHYASIKTQLFSYRILRQCGLCCIAVLRLICFSSWWYG
jgi:hypothetical protein